jgi:hypothetical protein
MEEISGLQNVLSSMYDQYTAGSLSFEQYATGVSSVQQQSPDMFNEAVNTPITAGGFSMDLPSMGNPEPGNIDFTGEGSNGSVAPNNVQPDGWENFSGLFNEA